jgi:hypothetical protein
MVEFVTFRIDLESLNVLLTGQPRDAEVFAGRFRLIAEVEIGTSQFSFGGMRLEFSAVIGQLTAGPQLAVDGA